MITSHSIFLFPISVATFIFLTALFLSVLTSFLRIGVIFYPNEDGDVMDIQADIIGPRK